MNVFYPPEIYSVKRSTERISLFLAGSIEMGKAEDWQSKVISELSSCDIDILNPRRPGWDSSWEQSIDNPNFKSQVIWELDALEKANLILMYLDPNTISPISLLELGIYAHTDKLVVVCPEGYFRKGNVDIVAEYYNTMTYDTLDAAIEEISKVLFLFVQVKILDTVS